MSPLRRALTLTTLALGLALGASSAALADTSFEHNTSFANAQGAKLTVLRCQDPGWGGSLLCASIGWDRLKLRI